MAEEGGARLSRDGGEGLRCEAQATGGRARADPGGGAPEIRRRYPNPQRRDRDRDQHWDRDRFDDPDDLDDDQDADA